MPLPDTFTLHRTALARIVAGLFAILGLTSGSVHGRIAKSLHRTVARALRPAESAVRRLIVFLAASMKAKSGNMKPLPPRPMPEGLVRTGTGKPGIAFQLFDTRPRLLHAQRRSGSARARPRISFFGDGEVRTLSLGPAPQLAGDGLETSASLVRRLQAVHAALGNLPHQARRLVRALMRRAQWPRLKLRGPLRPGRSPGFRKRPLAEIDILLHRCDQLAREALPDTS